MSDADQTRARQAAALMDNPLFKESLAVLREGYIQALMACDPKDDLGRARYAFALRDLATVGNHLNAVLVRGEISAHEARLTKDQDNVFKRAARGFV